MATARELTAEAVGIHPRDTLRAMELVQSLSTAIAVNLVDLAACSDSLRSVVDRDGIPL